MDADRLVALLGGPAGVRAALARHGATTSKSSPLTDHQLRAKAQTPDDSRRAARRSALRQQIEQARHGALIRRPADMGCDEWAVVTKPLIRGGWARKIDSTTIRRQGSDPIPETRAQLIIAIRERCK